MSGFVGKLKETLKERTASVWVLLSDTTYFLSRTSILHQYEAELADMRLRLSSMGKNEAVLREVRKALIELRESLRVQGYDLSLGKLELTIQGFRSDPASSEGFRRLVLFIGRRRAWYLAGETNHLELHRDLEALLASSAVEVLQKHYLWYRWNHGQLVISGADTESKEDFEAFKAWCANPERRLYLLGLLRKR